MATAYKLLLEKVGPLGQLKATQKKTLQRKYKAIHKLDLLVGAGTCCTGAETQGAKEK